MSLTNGGSILECRFFSRGASDWYEDRGTRSIYEHRSSCSVALPPMLAEICWLICYVCGTHDKHRI